MEENGSGKLSKTKEGNHEGEMEKLNKKGGKE